MDIKGNKNFYYDADSERVNKEKVGLLLNSAGILVTVGTSKAEVLNAFFAQLITHQEGRETVFTVESYNQQWMRIKSGIYVMVRIIPFL